MAQRIKRIKHNSQPDKPFTQQGHQHKSCVSSTDTVDTISTLVTWQPKVVPFAYNLQHSKDPPGLAGEASSNAQVS
jgi:hypothetical protein